MKKTIIIIASVAILGAMSYGLRQGNTSHSLVPAANTSSVSTPATQSQASQPSASQTAYKDGLYPGNTETNPYGTVQIAVVVSGGKITDINYLQMPSGRGHTDEVTAAVEPLLKQTTLQAQNANIDFVSGATVTSESYQASLQSALDKALSG